MGQTRTPTLRKNSGLRKKTLIVGFLSAFCILHSQLVFADTAASAYDPPWGSELNWADNPLFARPPGSYAYLRDNSPSSNYLPWWQTDVAHPITDYTASNLPVGGLRIDSDLEADLTMHRLLPGWSKQSSPSGIDNVYTFTPGSTAQENQTARSGQNAFFDLGLHPIPSLSADIGTEIIGNYDDRYYFPVNDEHRMDNEGDTARIVRGEIKYDDGTVMLRGFEGVSNTDWLGQNDLFHLLPPQETPQYYRDINGDIAPRGGEFRVKSPLGTLDVLGGTEPQWGYGSSVYARYDAPTIDNLEQSIVYRNENIPWGDENPNERLWTMSYNASYPFSDRLQGHAGVLYQPFRLDRQFQVVDSNNKVSEETSGQQDAFGGTARLEYHPEHYLDLVGLGYLYEGPVAGDKQEVDVDASRAISTDWNLSGAYIFRQPVDGPVPLLYEGTQANPGALIAEPRGPDDPFRVDWDNREAHILSLTLVYNPDPATPLFKYQRNGFDDWNLNADQQTPWVAALQYRATYYPTNTDRQYYYDEDRNLIFDPTFQNGALATSYPFSSATGLVRWKMDKWRVTMDLSGGQALAGAAIAYINATSTSASVYKPSTAFMSEGITVENGPLKIYFRYGQDVWGPDDYAVQFGWTYHQLYQAGMSYTFLRDFNAAFTYTGTRMTNDFIGYDMAAFNEYSCFISYHFTYEHNFGAKLEGIGRPLPQTFPEVRIAVSDSQFTPDGSGPIRNVTISPQASAESGILSWKLSIRNAQGETVRKWEGNGAPPKAMQWEGMAVDGKPLAAETYSLILDVVDLYGNEATSPAQTVQIISMKAAEPPPAPPVAAKPYTLQTTAEGLRVTLSSLILFDVNKYDLKDSAKEGLNQVIDLLRAYPTNALRVTGHTDAVGSDSLNQTLSERRAQAVADYIAQNGKIDPSRIKVVGYGKHRPVATNVTEEGRQQNRRVEIDILK